MLGNERTELRTQGYTVFRDALDPDVVGSLRTDLRDFFEDGSFRYAFDGKIKNDIHQLAPPAILMVLEDTKLIGAIKSAINGDLRFGHEVGAYANMHSGWHKDLHDVDFFSDPAKASEFGVYKLGLYLQDHLGLTRDDFALAVKPGTHLRADHEGIEKKIFVRAGDAIVFDCRISHRGQTDDDWPRSRFASPINRIKGRMSPALAYKIDSVKRRLLGRRDRLALFMVFGRENALTTEYVDAFHRIHCGGVCPKDPANLVSTARDALDRLGIRY